MMQPCKLTFVILTSFFSVIEVESGKHKLHQSVYLTLKARKIGMMSFQNNAVLGLHMLYAFNALTIFIEVFLGHTHINFSLFWKNKIWNVVQENCLIGEYILKTWLQMAFVAVGNLIWKSWKWSFIEEKSSGFAQWFLYGQYLGYIHLNWNGNYFLIAFNKKASSHIINLFQ